MHRVPFDILDQQALMELEYILNDSGEADHKA